MLPPLSLAHFLRAAFFARNLQRVPCDETTMTAVAAVGDGIECHLALSAVLDPLLATAEADEARLEEINQVAQAPSPESRAPSPEPKQQPRRHTGGLPGAAGEDRRGAMQKAPGGA